MDGSLTTEADLGINMTGMVVERGVLRDAIVNTLKAAIIRGQLKPGQKLTEKMLAEYLKVSRAPLREAFLKLEQEGLVTKLPHLGARVTVLSPQDVVEVYTLRIPLEGFAARLVTEKTPHESEIAQIHSAYDHLLQVSKEGDISAYIGADLDFHRVLWEASGNKRLVQMLNHLCTPLFGFSAIQAVGLGKPFSPEAMAPSHEVIVEAIEKETPDEAERVMREAIAWNRKEFVERCQN